MVGKRPYDGCGKARALLSRSPQVQSIALSAARVSPVGSRPPAVGVRCSRPSSCERHAASVFTGMTRVKSYHRGDFRPGDLFRLF